ncbi:15038_t:CDS:2 [Funneliformis geosporum]|nr:15038_t:CDS:2 [Funneliformis geosporum]
MATDLIEISVIMHNLVERLNDVWETLEDTDLHKIQYSKVSSVLKNIWDV